MMNHYYHALAVFTLLHNTNALLSQKHSRNKLIVMDGVDTVRKEMSLEMSSTHRKPSSSSFQKESEQHENDSFIKEDFEYETDAPPNFADAGADDRSVGQVIMYDTTLRDGTQGESISVSCDDKLKIASRLGAFGIDYIECGWPGSNPKDLEFFKRAQTELAEDVREKLVAFGSTRRKGVLAADDKQIEALVDSGTPTVCIVAKGHKWQVTDILRASEEENLDMIRDSVEYLTKHCDKQVFVDLEHFFDGFKYDSNYALQCCEAAVGAGAQALVLCDTNGGTMPWEVEKMTKIIKQKFDKVTVGVHVHNDCGMAVANSVVACKAGAEMVQGTINGIGERTGNANLCSVIPTLSLHAQAKISCAQNNNLQGLTKLSRFVDEIMNLTPTISAPFVGASAFAHKGGLHVAAMERNPDSYQHIDPSKVGNEMRVLVSELSGRQNIIGKIKEASDLVGSSESEVLEWNKRSLALLNRVKELENIGYTFEGADASVHLMILHATKGYCPRFRVLDYSVMVFDKNIDSISRLIASEDHNNGESKPTARATIKVRSLKEDSNEFVDSLEVSDGDGPVHALADALLNALAPSHPSLRSIELTDYKVRILDPESATGAATRVMIDFNDHERMMKWSTVSVDRNVITASLNALTDGLEYALIGKQDDECAMF